MQEVFRWGSWLASRISRASCAGSPHLLSEARLSGGLSGYLGPRTKHCPFAELTCSGGGDAYLMPTWNPGDILSHLPQARCSGLFQVHGGALLNLLYLLPPPQILPLPVAASLNLRTHQPREADVP